MTGKFLRTAGLAGMMAAVSLSASAEGTDTGWFKESSPYVTVRVGWLFGKFQGKFHYESSVAGIDYGYSMKQNITHAAEIGLTCRF